jgi:predicted nucleotide-binding protein
LAKELRATGYTLQRSRDSFDYRAHEFSAFIRALITDIQDDPEHWEAYTDEEYDEAPSEGAAPRVFIGHGRSLHWHVIERFLEKQLGLSTVAFESEARAGMHNAEVVEQMLSESHIAVIVMCGEDVTESGIARARQNVVLEAGLSQSAFGRGRTILLVQRGIELPSNLDGLQVLHFSGDRIEECFEGVREVLGREGLIE